VASKTNLWATNGLAVWLTFITNKQQTRRRQYRKLDELSVRERRCRRAARYGGLQALGVEVAAIFGVRGTTTGRVRVSSVQGDLTKEDRKPVT
jgi:hypothetical protein